ncbi:MAG: four-helix bundle copper-binding protein [Fibrobacteres bacterium]|nr:four-helix bundle copper-binding protein [Fibrobacterota bacterium]
MAKRSTEPDLNEIIETTAECARAARKCAAACLEEKDIAMLRECIRMDRDCAWICDLTNAFLLANSPFTAQACQLCAEICEACASECETHRQMTHCRECAEACRRCAEACRSIVSVMA